MSKLPAVSGRDCVKVLTKAGFSFKRQSGSHMITSRENPFAQVVVPDHKVLDRGTLRGILRHAGLSIEDFIRLL